MILNYRGRWPKIHETAFLAPSADVIGEVEIGAHSSIWFQCVLRGDVHSIRVGEGTNIQDQSILHVTHKTHPMVLGNHVTVGHRVILHGCELGDLVMVGMGSIILDGVVVGAGSLIGAGTLLTKNTQIPPDSLVYGSPGKVIRTLTGKERETLAESAQNYVEAAVEFRRSVPPTARMGWDNSDLENYDLPDR